MEAPSVEAGADAPKPTHSFWWRWLNVYISPGEAFQDVARKPSFITPLLAVVLAGPIVTEAMMARIGIEGIIRKSFEMSGRARAMDPEQLRRAVEGAVRSGAATIHLSGLVLQPAIQMIFMLVVAGIGFALLNGLFGERLDYRSNNTAVAVSCYAFLPSIVGSLTTLAVILLGDPQHFNPNNPIPSNVGYFLNPLETSRAFQALATSLDVLGLWTVVLLGIGFAAMAGRRVKASRVTLPFLGLWLVWVLGKVGLAALT
jgi:ABC-type iron transport system FetAB permease component